MNRTEISPEVLRFRHGDRPRDLAPRVRVEPADRLHLFDPGVSRTHGLAAAALYGYVAWHCRKFGKWVGTKAMLLTSCPYLSSKELRLALRKLLGHEAGFPPLLCRRGKIYTVVRRLRGKRLHSFDPKIAAQYGILPAVLLDNLTFWINDQDANGESDPAHYVSPAQWQEVHAYAPLRSVERAFTTLRLAGEIVIAGCRGRTPAWTVPFGTGCLDRWHKLHSRVRLSHVNKLNQSVYFSMPELIDEEV